MIETPPKRKDNRGGARPGAGRPPEDTERIWATLQRETRVELERFAAQSGIKRDNVQAYWDAIFRALLSKVELKEPEYLILARSITVRQVTP